ncbi:MAG: PD-(D/E)XK nuclease domain-containing protein [Anaerobutyricum soehngenii]
MDWQQACPQDITSDQTGNPERERFDLVLEPKVHFLPGIIMEFKATKNDAGLSASADEALKQIENKHYDTDMKDRGIKEIVKYGIAFAGKNVEIANG